MSSIAPPPGAATLSEATRLALYRQMMEIRYCEKRAYDLFLQNLEIGRAHV